MGIVKISDELHEDLRKASCVMSRSINAQAEFWIKIGMLAELNPHKSYSELAQQLLTQQSQTFKEMVHESNYN